MSEKEEAPSTSKSTGAPSRPTLSLPPRPFSEMFFNGGVGFSPGPMTLVSNMFPDSDEFRSFSQLLAGAMSSPATAAAAAAAATASDYQRLGEGTNSSSGDVDPRFKQNRPTAVLDLICNIVQGSYGMTHQQALAQVTAQAVQANANMQPQTEYPPPSQVQSFSSGQAQIPTSAPLPAQRETSDVTIIEHRSQQPLNVDKPADDGYNWRKYGQKQVKGSEFPRSYYKCTNPGCPVKKKVERSLDGQVTEIIYKGQHNHEPPQNTKRGNKDNTANINGSSINNNRGSSELGASQFQTNSSNKTKREQHEAVSQATTTEHLSEASDGEEVGNGETDVREKDENEPDPKRRSTEVRISEPAPAASHRTVTEPRIIVQTTSEVDLLDDGYRWRKYGQKVVKGNPYPRSYYKCTTPGCGVRKHVERAATDPKAVVTTYEGKHNHDLPAAKSSSHAAAAAQLRPDNRPGGLANLNQQQQQQPVARLRLKEEQTT
ncbi:Similar to DNA-binding proteins [Arabidopsis thaliana]|uniref:Isoform 2 of Probable WRKY transcription factor 4 n=1 Tax=Arabidopsis thaliana TaxID=3702 RepID=Q9XI90-2|nr:Similar to DNA-binding proteins [Arabidopsis thaliana]AAK28313.1 WRKY DNA-binding protein 4 [Arabidopsis thaliana]